MSFSASQLALLGLMAFALTGLLTWPIRLLAIRIGAMDKPNLERKTQKEPVPYLGGLSIALGVTALAYAGVVASDFTTTNFPLASYVLIPAMAMCAMGLIRTRDTAIAIAVWTINRGIAGRPRRSSINPMAHIAIAGIKT